MRYFATTALLLLTTLFAWASQGYLGISVDKDETGIREGLRIVNVFDDGAAWVAGLKENDLITHFNGTSVGDSKTFNRLLSGYQWGDHVRITYLRDGVSSTSTITLGYDVRTKTYEILKSEQITGEVIWYFRDLTTIIMNGGQPLSITKKFDDGVKETYDLQGMTDYSTVPMKFRDLTDKLDVIARCVEEQEVRGTDADQITFIKEALQASDTAPGMEEMRVMDFNVFPNPSTGRFKVNMHSDTRGELTWNIYDVRGSSVASGTQADFNGHFHESFDLTGKFSGTYLLYIKVGEQRISRQLILQ